MSTSSDDITTARIAASPTPAAPPRAWKPFMHPLNAMIAPKQKDLISPPHTSLVSKRKRKPSAKVFDVTSSVATATKAPPAIAIASLKIVSTGNMMQAATKRGIAR
jgi:hypothetical protein